MNVLLQGIVGSTAYGLAGPDSDVDQLGMFATPTADFHGLHPPVDKGNATHVSTSPDVTRHEARKYCLLALSCNPTVSELMWLPDELYTTRTPFGNELIDIRSSFLSAKRVRDAYLGYATSQLKRLVETGQFQSKMRSRSEKHGRHLLRLLDQGFMLYATGELPIRLEDPSRYFEFGRQVGESIEPARVELARAEERFNGARSPLPNAPDESVVETWLRSVRKWN